MELLSTIVKFAVWRNDTFGASFLEFFVDGKEFKRKITSVPSGNFSADTIIFKKKKYLIDTSGMKVIQIWYNGSLSYART